jgi:predicted nucleotidyltransferase
MDYTPYIKKLRERKAQEKMLAENKRQQALSAAQEIANALKRDFFARRVILFGSTLSVQSFHSQSDIDIAVEGIPSHKFFSAHSRALDIAKQFNIDLIDLKACRPALSAKIETEGREL